MKKRSSNPFLMILFLVTMLLFAMGSAHGSKSYAERHFIGYSMNSPPGETVTIAIEATSLPAFKTEIVSICIDRGTSVPYKGLINSVAITNIYQNYNPEYCLIYTYNRELRQKANLTTSKQGYNIATDPIAADLGLRYASSVT